MGQTESSILAPVSLNLLKLVQALHSIFPQNNLEKNGSYRNRENLQYKKTADSVLLSLFTRTNG